MLYKHKNSLWILLRIAIASLKGFGGLLTAPGVEIGDMTAKVDPNTENITEYHTAVKIAFGVEH